MKSRHRQLLRKACWLHRCICRLTFTVSLEAWQSDRYSLAELSFLSMFPGCFNSLRSRALAAVARIPSVCEFISRRWRCLAAMWWLQGEIRALVIKGHRSKDYNFSLSIHMVVRKGPGSITRAYYWRLSETNEMNIHTACLEYGVWFKPRKRPELA